MEKSLVAIEPTTLAAQLYDVQGQLNFLKEREDELKSQLLEELKKQGVKTVKLEDGTLFIRAQRQTLKVKDETLARKWAEEHSTLKLDTTKAFKILRRELKLPKFFKIDRTEYLSIKRPKGSQDEEIDIPF